MINKNLYLNIITSFLLVCGIVACGNDNDEESDGGAVTNSVSLENSILRVGAGTVTSVLFSFSSDDVFDDDRRVELVVHLPAILAYRGGTAEIKRPIDDRDINPSNIVTCSGGDTFLVFDLGETELVDADNPGGDPDAELRLTVDAVAVGSSTVGVAAHNDNVIFSCAGGMVNQNSAAVEVTP